MPFITLKKKNKKIDKPNALVTLPNIIFGSCICKYLDIEELLRFSATSKQLREMCESEWEKHVKDTFDINEKPVKGWRAGYISQRSRYFHIMSVHNKKLLNLLDDNEQLKVLVLGRNHSGKSNLVMRFVSDLFVEEYDQLIEDSYRKCWHVGPKRVFMDILDSSSNEFSIFSNSPVFYQQQDAFIIAFSISSEESFEDVPFWYNRISELTDSTDFNLIVVGCCADKPRVISKERGKAIAKQFHAMYFETSAKNNTNVSEVFDEIVWMDVRRTFMTGGKKKKGKRHKCSLL